jgi:adenine-specific DNA-methyltransferase
MARTPSKPLRVDSLNHDEASRKNAPTAELEAFVPADVKRPILAAYERRNPDLDPQLVWRGKDMADWSELVVEAPPLYIQEKIHPKALIEDLRRATQRKAEPEAAPDLFADFNGIAPDQKTEFYAHDQHWSNRMILGDGLKVMASLAEREGLKGQVQCIYIDPPYGIKFNSNFQWSTTSRDVKDGKADHFSREPEQVKAFRDTWADGIHSYLTYLRDRLTVARDLLTESGSVFVQIGEENVHRVRALMDEVFGDEQFMAQISFVKAGALGAAGLPRRLDYILWFSKDAKVVKFRKVLTDKSLEDRGQYNSILMDDRTLRPLNDEEKRVPSKIDVQRLCRLVSFTKPGPGAKYDLELNGRSYRPGNRWWGFPQASTEPIKKAGRLMVQGSSVASLRMWADYAVDELSNLWNDTASGSGMDKTYVVQTNEKVIQRCVMMATDPGDLVLDPTCGSGTTAYVAEQWGRRWITIDTSRVALALARARIMGARYPWYLLADSREGQVKEGELTRSVPADTPTYGRLRQGFVYKRVPRITLKSIANNAEVDTIWAANQGWMERILKTINDDFGTKWREWEVPRNPSDAQIAKATEDWVGPRTSDHPVAKFELWWELRISRQQDIDASIAAKADTEYLYDQPYDDKGRVRVAGPFTVESLSPHRVAAVDVDDSLFDELEASEGRRQPGETSESADFAEMVLENLRKSGVQQAHKADRLVFTMLKPWPGKFLCAEGRVRQASEGEGDTLADSPERRAAILVGPEYGTVARADLTAAAREAMEAGFDLLIAAAFNFDAHASEFDRMGALTVLQARINPDLHMPDLATGGAGNLFTVFGEPDIQVHDEGDGCISIEVAGIDMYKGGQIEASSADDIAVWFVDTDYDYESFFVRHAYFPGANDPYKALKTTLKAEIDVDAWESLKRTRSRPFPRPEGGKVAVKVINHLGDEVMKVVGV